MQPWQVNEDSADILRLRAQCRREIAVKLNVGDGGYDSRKVQEKAQLDRSAVCYGLQGRGVYSTQDTSRMETTRVKRGRSRLKNKKEEYEICGYEGELLLLYMRLKGL